MDLYGRALVDIAIDLIVGYLLCGQASTKIEMQVAVDDEKTIAMKERKATLATRFITKNAPEIAALTELICTGDKSTFTSYESLIGPVPVE
ncbi:MAG: hypothetical protein KAI59_00500, partial [Planctomycetes bacterium]|nr:hypothetical protein [Planctomycetota bacterium]